MARIVSMDGDSYYLTVPSDFDWLELVKEFPDMNTTQETLCCRRESFRTIFIMSRACLPADEYYSRSNKEVEWIEKDALGFTSHDLKIHSTHMMSFRPCLIPIDDKGQFLDKIFAEDFENGTKVQGGTAYQRDFRIQVNGYANLMDSSFTIGDTCLETPGCVLTWIWWNGKLICQDVIGGVWARNLSKIIDLYDKQFFEKGT